ncbi:DEAD/DEAH box helicase [Clostridium ihumii]|uniref:DEAD/DEAH box helicase n=1 Tax=Clostridium ihumii TaxID=1470356 RepID=UPI00058EA0E1|nr:DEAD/DEAH box helicase [Clostridium ihumii]
MLFENLNIIEPIKRALEDAGYKEPTLIQEKSIPIGLKGLDLLGCAQTGTGKTAAFAIPVLQNIINETQEKDTNKKSIKALILAPTRELAIQIGESFEMYSKYTNVKSAVIFGGVSQNPQVKVLKEGVDILIATPGRLIDLINQKFIKLDNVKHFVLDEADRMLDMGMIHDVKRIITKMPNKRQNMLFSATMPKEIRNLVESILKDPVKVEVAPVSSTVDTISQGVYFVAKKDKKNLLIDILKDESIKSLLVFSRTKYGANNITKQLAKAGIEALAIHGNKSQNARQIALNSFKDGSIRVLVATDIAARGIDVEDLSYVINYDLPEVPETYVHRIGRTGRAGHNGAAFSFCDSEERKYLRDIEKVIKQSIPVIESHKYTEELPKEVREIPKVERNKSERGHNNNSKNNKSNKNGRIGRNNWSHKRKSKNKSNN